MPICMTDWIDGLRKIFKSSKGNSNSIFLYVPFHLVPTYFGNKYLYQIFPIFIIKKPANFHLLNIPSSSSPNELHILHYFQKFQEIWP